MAGDTGPRDTDRMRFFPLAMGLGLFVGDVATLALRDELAVGRLAASGVTAVIGYAVARWFVGRRRR